MHLFELNSGGSATLICKDKILHQYELTRIHTNTLSLSHSVNQTEMHALWVSLKDNVRCNGNKVADVVGRASEICNRRNSSSGKANSGGEIVHGKETPARELMHRERYKQAQLYGKSQSFALVLLYIINDKDLQGF